MTVQITSIIVPTRFYQVCRINSRRTRIRVFFSCELVQDSIILLRQPTPQRMWALTSNYCTSAKNNEYVRIHRSTWSCGMTRSLGCESVRVDLDVYGWGNVLRFKFVPQVNLIVIPLLITSNFDRCETGILVQFLLLHKTDILFSNMTAVN